jgi:hypothetical protein
LGVARQKPEAHAIAWWEAMKVEAKCPVQMDQVVPQWAPKAPNREKPVARGWEWEVGDLWLP